MSDVEKISIALTAQQAVLLREAVASGEYASTSDIVREALQVWQDNREGRQDLAALRALWTEGRTSGPATAVDLSEVRQQARDRLAAKKTDAR